MNPRVLGISGSPIKNSNTDRAVHEILKSKELGQKIRQAVDETNTGKA